MFIIELQCFNKAFFQFAQEIQRSAQKRDFALQRTALRQIADSLVYDSLKNGKGDIRFGSTVV